MSYIKEKFSDDVETPTTEDSHILQEVALIQAQVYIVSGFDLATDVTRI